MTDGDDQHAGGDQLIAAAMLSRYRPLPNHSSNPRRHLAQLVAPSVSRSRGESAVSSVAGLSPGSTVGVG